MAAEPQIPQPTGDIAELLQRCRYNKDTPLGWIQGYYQRHAYVGPLGALGPVEALCGMEVTHCEPRPDSRDATCPRCFERSVWIRNHRPPASQLRGPHHKQPDATRPSIRHVEPQGERQEDKTKHQ
ncbi:hypothetical protein [Saccharopolyspora pogona]|uniref:hypothetical protein n=1 Tax=Saccharopolyspora pogona TaxID=333966 RepID=UPI0016886046|nr:hypothetical protein [Saccharopolyspora pogona]